MKKRIVPILFAILGAAIVLLPLLPKTEAEEEYTVVDGMLYRYSYRDGEGTLNFFDSDGMICTLPDRGHEGYAIDFTLGNSRAFVVTDMERDTGGSLYYVDKNGAEHIADGVYSAFISDSGSGAYITDSDAERRYGALYYYDGEDSICIEPRICTRLANGNYLTAAISPDGKTVAYCRDDGSGGIVGMLYHKGKFIELGADVYPIAVADKMEYIYYARLSRPAAEVLSDDPLPDSSYYVRSGKDDFFLSDSRYASFRFNRDLSEAMYSSGEQFSICIDGGREQQTLSGFLPGGVISPEGALAVDAPGDSVSTMWLQNYRRFGVDSFKEKIFHGYHQDDGIFFHDVCTGLTCPYHNTAYLDSELQLHMLSPDTYNLRPAAEGFAALYMQREELYLIPDVRTHTPGDEIRISQYCKGFGGSADLSTIYYVSTGSVLYRYRDGAREKLAEDAELLIPAGSAWPAYFFESRGPLPAMFGGKLYYTLRADGSIWAISPDGTTTRLDDIPPGSTPLALGDELLFVDFKDESIDFYRLDENGRATQIISDMPTWR